MLEYGADPNIPDKDRFTALGLSVRENHEQAITVLLANEKVNLNVGAGNLGSPLHIAVVNHKVEVVRKMVEQGADVNKGDNEGNTPMHQLISIYSKNDITSYKLMKLLITNGANPNSLNSQDYTPLLLAVKKKQKSAIRDMFRLHEDDEIQDWQASLNVQGQHSGSILQKQIEFGTLKTHSMTQAKLKIPKFQIFDLNQSYKHS